MKITFTPAEKIIIRNQRLIMLALANRCANEGGVGADACNSQLHARVRDMETSLDWIAAPSERI